MLQGDVIENFTVEKLVNEGQGFGRLDNFPVFVDYGAPGDIADLKIIVKKKNYARARIAKLKTPSLDRADPPCPVFGLCGACQWQHLQYSAQLKAKKSLIKEALERIGKMDSYLVEDVVGMEEPWNYRNKIAYPIKKIPNPNAKSQIKSQFQNPNRMREKIILGYYRQETHDVVDIENCLIVHPMLNQAAQALKNIEFSVYDEKKHTGLARHFIARHSLTEDAVVAGFSINGETFPQAERLVEQLEKKINLKGFFININTQQTNTILGEANSLLFGESFLVEKINQLQLRFSFPSFFQVNPLATAKLYMLVEKLAELSGQEKVTDLYCGVGGLGLSLAGKAKPVTGLEENAFAIEDALENASQNGIKNTSFIAGPVEKTINILEEKQDLIIIDPPRVGISPFIIGEIIKNQPRKIIYVSCNPATLARDLKIFCEASYKLKRIIPLDMFPQTYHVETIALLEFA